MTTAEKKTTTRATKRKRRVVPKWVAVPTNLEDIFREKQLAGETGDQPWVVAAAMALAMSSLANGGRISQLPSELKRITGGRIGVVKALGSILEPHPADDRYLCIPELLEPLTDAANSAGKHLDNTDLTDEEFAAVQERWKRNADEPNRAYDFPAQPQKTAKQVHTYNNKQAPTSVVSSSLRSEPTTEVGAASTWSSKKKKWGDEQRTRGTAWPEGWSFGPDELAVAASRRVTLSDKQLQREFQKFEDYSRSKGRKFVDWKAAWRNWVSNAERFQEERAQQAKDNGGPFGNIKARIL